ncbi:actin binding protein [Coemansia sp. S146]|nr:actin binding protein [Coemansia sp. S146]
MSSNLDLSAHANEIASTHQRIVGNDHSISWAVYGFDRGGNALNVQAQGSGSLEDLADEFDDGKVQFGFVRVEDPNTRLPKFVFISWCGQGVPVFRKGLVSSQVGEVQQVLSGSHVTVIARCADDIQASEIMDKVERSSGAQYSYHTQPKRQPPAPAAKPAFGAGSSAGFKKGATYGAPAVTKNASWGAAAAAAKPPPPSAPAAKPSYVPKLTGGAPPSIGGTKPLFGGASSGGRPASSFFGGGGRSGPSSAATTTTTTKPLYQSSPPVSPLPPKSPVQEPVHPVAPPATAYKSQQEERQAELDALRRGSRGQSPANVSRGVTPTLPPMSAGSRLGAGTPTEPSAQFTQADQTKNELEMLRNRRLLNSNLGGASGPMASAENEASERKAELEALRRARGGSQSALSPPAAPPTHSWKQPQSPPPAPQYLQAQQREEEEARRRRQQEEEEEEKERRKQQQQQQRDEEQRRAQQQMQRDEEERRLLQQEQDAAKAAEAERQRSSAQSVPAASSRGPLARAVYDYDAEAEDELAFKEGEIIYSVDQLDPGWWAGESEDGLRQGVFPANFVEMIEDSNVDQVSPVRSMPPPPPPVGPVAPPPPPAPMAPAPPPAPMAPAPPPAPMAPPAPPMAPVAPPPPPMAPPPPPMAPAAPPAPALPPRGPASEAVPGLPPRGGPALPPMAPPPPPAAPMAPPPPPAAPTAPPPPMLPPRGGPPAPMALPPPPPPAPAAVAPPQQDLGENYATAVYDYDADEEGELSFKEGEIITHIEFPSSEWWEGVNQKGEYGLFPANYVELDSQ